MNICIIGTGNIGTDLLHKIQKNEGMKCVLFVGQRAESAGLKIAENMGIPVSTDSVNAIVKSRDTIDLIFDATSADAHKKNSKVFREIGIPVIDLTPAKVGKMCVPVLNSTECKKYDNINMITCGGQALIPIAHALCDACGADSIEYLEIVACISSNSAGKGTRENIDEFTQTTKDALGEFTGVKNTKAIIILNPAIPEHNMRNTLYCYVKEPNMELVTEKIEAIVAEMQTYIPGYRLLVPPVYDGERVTVTVEVEGAGDYLPTYAGNLDIITSASVQMEKTYFCKE